MRTIHALVAAVCLAAISQVAAAAPLEAYGKLPSIEDAALSSDGKLLALTITNGDERKVVVRDTATGKDVNLVAAGNTKLRDLQWAGPQYLLITYSVTSFIDDVNSARGEHRMTSVYDVKANKMTRLFARTEGETLNVTVGTPNVRIVDGKPLILVQGVRFVDHRGHLTLFQNVPGASLASDVVVGSVNTDDFIVDEAGRPLAQTEYDRKTGDWAIVAAVDGDRWRTVATGKNPYGSPWLLGAGRTPGTLVVEMDDKDGAVAREVNVADGKWADLPFKPGDGIIRGPTGRVIGARSTEGDVSRYSFLDKADQAIWATILKAYPGQSVELVTWSDDHQKAVVRVDSATEGPAFAYIDIPGKKAEWIGPEYAGVEPQDISPKKPISYKAADGLEITGYLTLPKGKPAKNLPLVVLPHGGPASRDHAGFDWWSQALAAQGYAVLQPNFRGSNGLGVKLLEAGYGEFGKKMQTDLSDGVRDLAAKGVIDPKRVCIVGASYGGYAALAGATLDAGVYRCAASVAGISDLKKMLKDDEADFGAATFRYWSNFLGVSGVKDPDLAAISPLTKADKVDIPVLLVHGKNDTVVHFEQSKIMADALKKAGKPVTFVTLEGEDHWLSSGVTRQKMLAAVVDFLAKNNPPN